jgi:D-3-phosphoglycerate dehydrogenase
MDLVPASLRVALVGDRFVTSGLLRAAIESAVERAMGGTVSLRFAEANVDWPDVPLQAGDEVGEFVGDPAEVAALARDADVLVVHVAPVTRALLEACPNLRLVAVARGGALNVNVAAAAEREIPVVYAPGRNARSATEFTLALMLAACRSIAQAHVNLRDGLWETHYCRYDEADSDLHGRTVGLVGFGTIAQGLMTCLRPFDVRVLAYDPYTPYEPRWVWSAWICRRCCARATSSACTHASRPKRAT